MSENDLRNEILQSTQRLMSQIDQIKPIEINPEEIEKSQAFINRIENEQIQNIEKSHSLLRDVTDWGDKRKDQYDEFEKPLLKTVEKSVHASEEVAKSAIPLLQEKINNYDRHIGDLKSSIASMSDAISKMAKEAYEMTKNGNDSNLKPEEPAPFFQFSVSDSNENNISEDDESMNAKQKSSDDSIDNDTSFDMVQSLKLREEHLLNVVQALSNEMKALKNSIKAEQGLSKNFHYELEYIKNHAYSPTLSIDSDNSIQYEQYKEHELLISSNNPNNNSFCYEIPLIVIEYKNQNESTKELEEMEEKNKISTQKVTIYQNFDVFDIDPNDNYDFLKDHIINEVKNEYYLNLKDQSIQNENEKDLFLSNDPKLPNESENNSISHTENSIETFEIANITSSFSNTDDLIGKVTITKEKGNDHHIFNYSENMNSQQAADDLDELINFHRLCKNEDNDNEYDETQSLANENEIKLQQVKIITDFKHAAKIVYNSKTGKREILTENNIRMELKPINDNLYSFISMNGQHLNVILEPNENQQINDDNNINQDEIVENRDIYIANEKNDQGEKIKLQVIINKDGESYVTNNDSESKSRLFFDSKGSTFVYDNTNSVQIPVVMNETGQIMYEMSNSEFIQLAMMNIQSELFYINEKGEKMLMKIDEDGNFYVLSSNGQRIPINIFKNLNADDQINSEIINENDQQKGEENINNDEAEDNCTNSNIYQDGNNLSQDRFVPVSISRKDNELKIIYKDNEDAVVVNTSISHTTQDGQIILRPNTNVDSKPNQNLGANLAVKGVKFNLNDNPGTRVTRIVGGFNKSFVRGSRRKKFNWTVRPSYQVVKLNIKPQPPRCYFHQPARDRNLANAINTNEPQTNPSTAKEVNKNTSLRWIAFPVRPPPLCCRKTSHLDLSVTGIPTMPEGPSNQPKETQSNERSETAKYVFNKRKIVQPESKINKVKLIHEQSKFKSEQSQRKIFNNNLQSRNPKFTASPSPRRQLHHQQMKHLNPITPSVPPQMSVQPAPRIKFNAEADFTENKADVNSNLNISTIELPQF